MSRRPHNEPLHTSPSDITHAWQQKGEKEWSRERERGDLETTRERGCRDGEREVGREREGERGAQRETKTE